jgi:hypothetical protein
MSSSHNEFMVTVIVTQAYADKEEIKAHRALPTSFLDIPMTISFVEKKPYVSLKEVLRTACIIIRDSKEEGMYPMRIGQGVFLWTPTIAPGKKLLVLTSGYDILYQDSYQRGLELIPVQKRYLPWDSLPQNAI